MSRFHELLDEFFYRPDEEVEALFDPGQGADELPPAAQEEAPREYLAFRLAEEMYALPIEALREITKVPVLTEVPRAPRSLLGVLNLRGEVLPVYDLKLRLGLSDTPAPIAGPQAQPEQLPRSARILVVNEDGGDAGLLVDQVLEVVRLRPSTIEAPPRAVSAEGSAIVGLGRRREQLFILIDLAQALP